MLKELQNKLTKESEQIKQEKAEQRQRKVAPLITPRHDVSDKGVQDAILNEMSVLSDGVLSTRSRIVQSPERIKRNIVTMSAAALEDKKIVSTNEAKTRDLQAKIGILFQVEKVCGFSTPSCITIMLDPGCSCLYGSSPSYTEGERSAGSFIEGPD